MNRRYFNILLICALALIAVPAISNAAGFSRNLSKGMKGDDVVLLQKILNINPATAVAVTGPGSKGNETSLFGPATKKAVIKFQNLYATDVLAPGGLAHGTGYAGTYTIKKLMTLLPLLAIGEGTTPPIQPQPPVKPSPPIFEKPEPIAVDLHPVITDIHVSPLTPLLLGEPEKLSTGAPVFDNTNTVIITGKNFTKSNTVNFTGNPPLTEIASTDGTTLSFTFNSVVSASIEKSLNSISSSSKGNVIDSIIAGWTKKHPIPELTTKGMFVKMNLQVANENGTSAVVPIVVNIAKGL